MASENWETPSTGQSFDSPSNGVSDHSPLAAGFPSFGSSMDGGNATSATPEFGAPGSDSEGYDLVWDTAHDTFGDPTAPITHPGPDDSGHVNTKVS